MVKEPYKRDNILQKRPIILSILLTVATPYHELVSDLLVSDSSPSCWSLICLLSVLSCCSLICLLSGVSCQSDRRHTVGVCEILLRLLLLECGCMCVRESVRETLAVGENVAVGP